MNARTALLIATLAGCSAGHRSPSALRDAYVQSLDTNDPRAAYDLLAPEVRASLPYEEFEARWRNLEQERALAAKQVRTLPEDMQGSVYEAQTAHADGVILDWTEVDDRFLVTSGLPGIPDTATPAQTVRAFVQAVRRSDLSGIAFLVSDELASQMREDWEARVEALEAALDRPSSIEVSEDLRRAELRYEPNRVLTMEQSREGWRITSLE